MAPDWSLDVGVPPDAALQRLAAAINQRPKRAFGLLKTENEFVGAIARHDFEVWERRQRAVHAVGTARAKTGGTRVEVRFVIPPLNRALLLVFSALYVVVVAGISSQPPDASLAADEAIVAVCGAALLGALFYGAARRQRADLARFLETVFSDRTQA